VWGCDRVIWSKWDQKGFKMSPVLGGRLSVWTYSGIQCGNPEFPP